MIRKSIILVMISFCILGLTGCTKVIDLTDEETQLIAEYAAELLLKYDINYVDKIEEGQKKEDELLSEMMQTTQETTQMPTEEVEESTDVSEEKEEPASEQETTQSDVIDDKPAVQVETDIAKVLGMDDVTITFRDYAIVDKYPATDEQGEFIYLEASQGYQLLVLHFDVKNTTSDIVNLSLIDKEIDYRIVCNDTKAAKPMLTILMNDLGTYEMNVEPDIQEEAVLIFQVSDGMKDILETIDLYVTYNDSESKIQILQ
ncbi:MAG: hypothetical protein E7264_02620 [Lachnospiraceae bacterium]|nr:hypothetical protein [Lachnospiraceae bacterium]